MQISLSTTEALTELKALYHLGQKPGFICPSFNIETEFIKFYFYIIDETPKSDNVVPFMNRLIDQALTESTNHICSILEKHKKVDGTEIFNLMQEKQFITLGVKKAYNKQVPGKSPKGFTSPFWNTYNNWLLADIFWKAYVQAHDPELKVTIVVQEDSDAPVEALYSADFKPLWIMKQAYIEDGPKYTESTNDDIYISPLREWFAYIKEHPGLTLPKHRINNA